MKRMLRLILICIYYCVLQSAFAGTEINNGGAGISINGEVATFYSAEMKVNPTPLTDVPSIDTLLTLIKKLNLPKNVQMELSESIRPSFDRTYYAVSPETINQATLKKIKEEYSKLTNKSPDQITIFALTDPERKITLLLPDFFKLNDNEKVAILLHESLWINKRVKTYANMLEIEKDMQIYATYPNDCTPRYNLIKKIESIFKEKLWALNAIFRCQTDAYHVYSNAESVAMTDFLSHSEMDTFARILLTSLSPNPLTAELHELFLKQINEPTNFKTFLGSKRALVQALQNDELEIRIDYKTKLSPVETPFPASQKNVDALIEILKTSNVLYGFSNYTFFEMNIANSVTAKGITLTITDKNTKKY